MGSSKMSIWPPMAQLMSEYQKPFLLYLRLSNGIARYQWIKQVQE